MTWDLFNAQKVKELTGQIFDLEHALFEERIFGEIASEKLKVWVEKHDELLGRYKKLESMT